MTESFKIPAQAPLIIVISGPSGVGKDTVIKQLKNRGLPLHFVVTENTRAPRAGEVNGVDYFFISKDQFNQMLQKGELLEYAHVYDDYKGVAKDQVRQALASGKDVILRLDVQGAATIRRLCPDAVLIFLTPTCEDELVQRLESRETESGETLKTRLTTAEDELNRINLFDYFVVNAQGQLQAAVDSIVAIINAEHHRVVQRKNCL